MNRRLPSCQSECPLWLNTLHAYGPPLPAQGEGEGEGLSKATRTVRARADCTPPHLSPLPFSEGRGGKDHVGFRANFGAHNMGGDSFAFERFAINNRQRE